MSFPHRAPPPPPPAPPPPPPPPPPPAPPPPPPLLPPPPPSPDPSHDDYFSNFLHYPLLDSIERNYCSDFYTSSPHAPHLSILSSSSFTSSISSSPSSYSSLASPSVEIMNLNFLLPQAALPSSSCSSHGAFMTISSGGSTNFAAPCAAGIRSSLSNCDGGVDERASAMAASSEREALMQRCASAEGALALGAKRAAGLSGAAIGRSNDRRREIEVDAFAKVKTSMQPPPRKAAPSDHQVNSNCSASKTTALLSSSSSSSLSNSSHHPQNYSSSRSSLMPPFPHFSKKPLLQPCTDPNFGGDRQLPVAPPPPPALRPYSSSLCFSSSVVTAEEAAEKAESEQRGSCGRATELSGGGGAEGGGGQSVVSSVVTEAGSNKGEEDGKVNKEDVRMEEEEEEKERWAEAAEEQGRRRRRRRSRGGGGGAEAITADEWGDDPDEEDQQEQLLLRHRHRHRSSRSSSSKRNRTAQVHNLSERNRRNRINEKLKALQSLMPNSTKTDKASVLDEAIEYMKTLQMQLQMASMRSYVNMSPVMIPIDMPHLPMATQTIGLGLPIGHPGMGFGISQADAYQSAVPGISHFGMPYPDPCHQFFSVAHNSPHLPINSEFHPPVDPISIQQQQHLSQFLDEQGYAKAHGILDHHHGQAVHYIFRQERHQYDSRGPSDGNEIEENGEDKMETLN